MPLGMLIFFDSGPMSRSLIITHSNRIPKACVSIITEIIIPESSQLLFMLGKVLHT